MSPHRTPLRTAIEPEFDIRIASTGTLEAAAGFTFTGGTILLQSGTLYSSGTVNFSNNRLAGTGTVSGSLVNGGSIEPGALTPPGAIGTITVSGNLAFGPTGRYVCDVNSTSVRDQLNVGGALALAGGIEARAGASYTPTTSDQIAVAHSSMLSGEFRDFTFPDGSFGVAYTATDALLVVFDYFVDIGVEGRTTIRAAADPAATDGYDAGMDLAQGDSGALAWFSHPEWGGAAGSRFKRDVRQLYDPATAMKSWLFVVDYQNSSAASELVELAFAPSFTAADGMGLTLRDRTTGQTINLFPDLHYSFYAPPYNREVREFDLYVGRHGWTAEDTDADGVLDVADACIGVGAACFDRDGDGCVDEVTSGRHIEYWPQVDMPLAYRIHEGGAPGITDGSDFTAIQAGFDAWAAVPGAAIAIDYQGTTPQSDSQAMDFVNLVTFADPDWPFGASVLAVGLSTSFTIPVWDSGVVYRPGQIIDADMIFNPALRFQTPTMGQGADIQSIATHEAGHMLGLSHSAVVTSTMFYVLPPLTHAAELTAEDRQAMFKGYPRAEVLTGASQLRGVVTSGWDGHPVGGAIIFAINAATHDTVGCDFTLPDDGSYQFVGLPDGDYYVAPHPLDGSSAIGHIGPANINELIRDRAEILFTPEYWDAAESATDDGNARTPLSVAAGSVTHANLITNIDNQGPRVVAVSPQPGGGDIPVDAAVLVKFSERVHPDSFRGQFNLSLTPDGALIPGTPGLVRDDSTLAYIPRRNFEFDTTYYLRLGGGITDRYGNLMATPPESLNFHFTTQPRPAVSLDSLIPREGGAGAVVVVNGRGFSYHPPLNSVQLGADALPVRHASATQLVIEIPAGLPSGVRPLTVTTNGETSNPLNFTVLESEVVARGFEMAAAELPALGRAVEVSPDGALACVATAAGLSAVDVTTPDAPVVTSLPVAGGLDAVALTPGGQSIFAVSTVSRRLYRFQREPVSLLSEIGMNAEPLGILIEPGGRKAYVPTRQGVIQIWDVQLGSLSFQEQIGAIAVPGGNLLGKMAIDPAGERLLALAGNGRLLVFATASDSLLATIAVGTAPRDVIVDPVGALAYVTDLGGGVTEISLSGLARVAEMPTGGSLLGADVKPTGTFLYTANNQLDVLDVIDLRPDSRSYRSLVSRVPHRPNPIDVAFAPDGLYAYSLSATDQVLVVSATGEGPLLASLSPRAGPVGAQVVLSGSGFDGAGVTFRGVTAPILHATDSALTVTVPTGAATGPVTVLGAASGTVSNSLTFEVLAAAPPADLRPVTSVQPPGTPQFAPALAVSPAGDVLAVGGQDGRVHLLDIDAGSATFNEFVREAALFASAVGDIAIAPDGGLAYVAASGSAQVQVLNVDRRSPQFGEAARAIDLGGVAPGRIALTPSGARLLVADPGAAAAHLVDLTSDAVISIGLQGTLPDLNGQASDLAVHPVGTRAYLAIGDDDPAAVLVLDLDPASGTFAQIIGSVALPSGSPAETPIALGFAPDGASGFVLTSQLTGAPHRTLVVLDTSDPAAPVVTASTPLATDAAPMDEVLQVAPQGNRLLVNIRDDGLRFVDLATLTVSPQPGLVPAAAPLDFGYTADGSRVYVVSTQDHTVRVCDFLAEQRIVKVWGDGQTGVIGDALASPLRVRVIDLESGEGSSGIPVVFTVLSGEGLLAAAGHGAGAAALTVGTDQFGYAQASWTLGPVTGAQQVQVACAGASGTPLLYSATGVDDPSAQPLALLEHLLAPIAGADSVSVNTSILATFNRPVDLESITDATFFLTAAGDTVAVATIIGLADGDRKASLTPVRALSHGTTYTLHVDAAVRSAGDGSLLANPQQTTFATAPAPPSPLLRSVSKPGAQPTVEVVLAGGGFDPNPGQSRVRFNGVPAQIIECLPDRIRTRVPLSSTSGPLDVEVGGQPSNALPFSVLAPMRHPTNNVIARAETGTATRTAVVSPDGTLLYALASEADLVKPIDLTTLTPLAGIPVGDAPRALTVHPSGAFIYVANEASGDVSVIDISAGSATFNAVIANIRVGVGPFDLAVTPDGERVIVVNPGSADLSVIDSDPSSENFNQVISRVETGTASRTVAVTPDGTRVYVGTEGGYLILSAVGFGVVRNVSTGTATRTVEVTPDGTLLALVDTQGLLRLYDIVPGSGREDQVVARPSSGTAVRTATVSPDGTLLFVVQEGSDQILVLALVIDTSVGVIGPDAATQPTELEVVAIVTAGANPQDVVFDPTGSGRFFVPCAGEGALFQISPPTALPAPIETLAAARQLQGNPPGETIGIAVTWTPPPGELVCLLYRRGFGNYPEYDDEPNPGAAPETPADPDAAVADGWILATETAGGSHIDQPPHRDYWYYVAFARDAFGRFSTASPLSSGTLNYVLGDVSDGDVPGLGDNRVDVADVSLLGACYGAAEGNDAYRPWLDVGPTHDFGPAGLPLTDNIIDFEDMMVFAMNYGIAARTAPPPAAAAGNRLALRIPAPGIPGEIVDLSLQLAGDGRIQGLSIPVTWDADKVEPAGFTGGALLDRQGVPFLLLSPAPGVVDAALAGVREGGLSGEGELARLRFRVLAAGDPGFALGEVKARSGTNEPLAIVCEQMGVGAIPAAFALHGARPNPFNPVTRIAFDLPREARVRLGIYDVSGRHVVTLVDEPRAPGSYSVLWDGTNGRGAPVASGLYLYRLEADDFRATRKLLLVR